MFESHHSAVYGFVLRSCSDPTVAEDLTQDVFVRALRAETNTPEEASERPWLFRIARNLVIDRWRQTERRPQPVAVSDTGPIAVTPSQGLRIDLDQALSDLPEAEREAFILREVAGLSYAEICEIAGASEAAIRSRIYRARQQLRTALHDDKAPKPKRPRAEETRNGT